MLTEESRSVLYLACLLQLFLSCRVSSWLFFPLNHLPLLHLHSVETAHHIFYDAVGFFPPPNSPAWRFPSSSGPSQYDLLVLVPVALQFMVIALLSRSYLCWHFFLAYPFFFFFFFSLAVYPKRNFIRKAPWWLTFRAYMSESVSCFPPHLSWMIFLLYISF